MKKGSKVKTKEDKLLDTPAYVEYKTDLVKLIHEGWRTNELYAEIFSREPNLSNTTFYKLLQKAYDEIRTTFHRDKEFTFQLHMERYEELYKQLANMEDNAHRELSAKQSWALMVGKLSGALKVLRQKEELVGIHNKNVTLEVTTTETIVTQDTTTNGSNLRDQYNINKLSLDEQIELLQLLQATRIVPIEGVRQVVVKKTTTTVSNGTMIEAKIIRPNETIDVTYEEMPERVIHKIEHAKPVEMEKDFHGPIVEDYVDRTIQPGKSIEQIQEGIQVNIKQQFEKLMKRTIKPKSK